SVGVTGEEVETADEWTWAAIRNWLGIAWLTGTCAYLLLNILRAMSTRQWLRRERRPLEPDLQVKIAEFFMGRGFKHLPKIWVIENLNQPFVWGLLRGSVYVPADLLNVDSLERQKSVLGHELGHVVRFDAGVSLLQVIAQGIFWFHPFVWWANLRIRRERERCCDEMTVAGLSAEPKDYSMAILEALTLDRRPSRRVPSLAIVGPANNLEQRIRAILRPGRRFYRRPTSIVAATVLILAVLTVPTALVLTTWADAKEETTKEEKTDVEKEELKGPVRVVRIESVESSEKPDGGAEGTHIPSRTMVYDVEGRLLKDVRFSRSGIRRRTVVYTYDEEGKRAEEREYAGDDVLLRRVVYIYDDKGNLAQRIRHHDKNGRVRDKLLCSYDDGGHKIREVEYDAEGKVNWECVYLYNDEGRKYSETCSWIKGDRPHMLGGRADSAFVSVRKSVRTFDVSGNNTQTKYFKADGSLHRRWVHTYDGIGNCTKEVLYDSRDRTKRTVEYTYDTQGRHASVVVDTPNDHSETVYVCNDMGDVIQQTHSRQDGDTDRKSIWKFEYEYDSIGNWTKRTRYFIEAGKTQSKPPVVTYRTIAYARDHAKAQELQADLPQFESKPHNRRHVDRVQVRLYGDSDFDKESYFFDRTGATLPGLVHFTVQCAHTGSNVSTPLSGGLYDPSGRLVYSFLGQSTDAAGSHKGSYQFQRNEEPGVWLIKVSSGESEDTMISVAKPFHLYSGTGVSSYKMDFVGSSFAKETILENKHLIAVFGNSKMSNKVLLHLYQKDSKTDYTFGKTNVGRFDHMYNRFDGFGELTSEQSIQRTFSCNLSQESEGLGSCLLTVEVSLIRPLNEISHGAYEELGIWEKKGSSGYERVWSHIPDTTEAADHAVGDVDNDGKNEIVWVTSGNKNLRGRVYVTEHTSGTYRIDWTSDPILGYQPRVAIADSDNDGFNELVVAAGFNRDISIFEHDGADYVKVYSNERPTTTNTLAIGDFDRDGANEIVTASRTSTLYVYEYDSGSYTQAVVSAGLPEKFFPADMDSGDIDGDGFPELLVSGRFPARFIVVDHVNDSFCTSYLSETLPFRGLDSCAFGDPDNDGNLEVVVGTDRLMYFECSGPSEFINTWNSPSFGGQFSFLNHMIDIEDGDNDGLNEILFIKPNVPGAPSMWGSKTGGPPFIELWTFDGVRGGDHVHGLDCDSDGSETSLTIDVALPSEDAEWLEYRAHSMNVDPNIHSVFPILSGSIGPKAGDDRYHLESDTDELISSLKRDAWHNFSSNYCMVYDNSDAEDTTENTLIAWVRRKESENVKFQDVGLWNDSKGRAASRMRYDIKDATDEDWFSYLLVFTKGGRRAIDRWMPVARSYNKPEVAIVARPTIVR
ncbi:MAG: M56 family metallopeptidase, partial [Planctomycetota bacterium]